MAQVFISHSKDDEEGREFFNNIFSSINHKGFWYSWEGPEPPHALTLLNEIKKSQSLFVVLSYSMEQPQTRSWVGYEVGIAVALKKNVWVFEPENGYINVPVPYVTGYVQFPQQIENLKIFPYYHILNSAGKEIPQTIDPSTNNLIMTTCTYSDCKAEYYTYILRSSFLCPVCRREIEIVYEEKRQQQIEKILKMQKVLEDTYKI